MHAADIIDWVGIGAAFAAALLWFKSASVPVPPQLFEFTADRTNSEREREWAKQIARWNKYAAAASGASAFCFATGEVLARAGGA